MTSISARQVLGPEGWITNGSLEIADGLIAAVNNNAPHPDHAYLIPGYIDLQVNGFRDVDLATCEPGQWAAVGSELARHGTTSWLPTLISRPLDDYQPWLAAAHESMTSQIPGTSRVLGVHLEGPWLGQRPGAHTDIAAGAIDLRWIKQLPDLVKLVTLCPERPGALQAIDALRAQNIIAALGHTNADHPTATEAFDRGAAMLTHCFNANPPMHHRAPGIVGAALARDDVVISIIADGHHVHQDMIRIAIRAKGANKIALISDSSGWASGSLGTQHINLIDETPTLDNGSLAGSALTLHQAVRFVIEHCDTSPENAIRSASTIPANLLKLPNLGRITHNAQADLIALDDHLNIRAVWLAGKPLP